MLYACFSSDYNYVYAYSSTKNLYIMDKSIGKLILLLVIPFDKVEINSMIVGRTENIDNESLVVYSRT